MIMDHTHEEHELKSSPRGIDYDFVKARVSELEHELEEFQESSKELEQALEDELRVLEAQNVNLIEQIRNKDERIDALGAQNVRLSDELRQVSDQLFESEKQHETELTKLKMQMVAIEIANDDMALHDRVIESKLHYATQFNNELMERVALLEHDLCAERELTAQQGLTILNMKNGTGSQRVVSRKRDSTLVDFSNANGTVLDINEMLATEPQPPVLSVPRSDLLMKFQELCARSEDLRQKVSEVSTSLTLKANATIQVSPDKAEKKRTITNSASYHNLSKLSGKVENRSRDPSSSSEPNATKNVPAEQKATFRKRVRKIFS